ncbi:TGS domain-containing protein [Proteinivorax hydrogeniformans]|uniref:TGS domain-containing protein n=1 Tax=Proteinivorax hydrogeniformans TaxID=1826727 RepID=A0AAU8HUV0_9FIRM
MAANLTPQYYAAEEAYKKATTTEEKIAHLEEMLAVIPKHKGTEKIQGELRKKLSKLKKSEDKGGSKKTVSPFVIEKQGAGQVFLLGFPNCGKSAFVGKLTAAKTEEQPYPFSTFTPVVGMLPYHDVFIQLVDTPPIDPQGISGEFASGIKNAHLLIIMVDFTDGDCIEHIPKIQKLIEEKRIINHSNTPGVQGLLPYKVLWVGNKFDSPEAMENFEVAQDLVDDFPDFYKISVKDSLGLDNLTEVLFQKLEVNRIYTKAPGKDPDFSKPFTLPKGSTILDLAEQIHKDIAANLEKARVWGSAKFDGQWVNHDHVLQDKDVVELSSNT